MRNGDSPGGLLGTREAKEDAGGIEGHPGESVFFLALLSTRILILNPEISVGQFADQEIVRMHGRRRDKSYPHLSSLLLILTINKGGEQWLVNGRKTKG